MLNRRITYLVGPNEEVEALKHASAGENRVTVSDLYAAKHVRVSTPTNAPVFRLTWSRYPLTGLSAVGQPFDPPCEVGLRVDAPTSTDWTAVASFVGEQFATEVGNSINAESWLSFVSENYDAPQLSRFHIPADADAVRATVISGELVVEAWYSPRIWTEVTTGDDRIEVGIFGVSGSADDRILSGRIRELSAPNSNPARFHTYPRARPLSGKVDVGFNVPYGLHPTLQLDVNVAHRDSCNLMAKLDLPPSVFIDKYQMETDVEEKQNLRLVKLYGETDLEAPVWAVDSGSIALFKLLNSTAAYDIPLHFRYAEPFEDLYAHRVLPPPLVFWECPGAALDSQASEYGFIGETGFGGVASVFNEDTAFYYASTSETVYQIPAIGSSHRSVTECVTFITIVLGFVIISVAVAWKRLAPESKEPEKIAEGAEVADSTTTSRKQPTVSRRANKIA